jgi:hypothetical protein
LRTEGGSLRDRSTPFSLTIQRFEGCGPTGNDFIWVSLLLHRAAA